MLILDSVRIDCRAPSWRQRIGVGKEAMYLVSGILNPNLKMETNENLQETAQLNIKLSCGRAVTQKSS